MTFPGEKLVLGRNCGPSIYLEPALTVNILRKNGQQVHRSTYRELTPYELVNPDDIKACDEFDTAIEEKLGPTTSAKYFDSEPEISHRLLIGMRMIRSIKITWLRCITLRLRR